MKIFILGAKGQLGTEWRQYLKYEIGREVEVRFLDLPEFNITNKKSLEDLLETESPDIIVNCAAYTKVDQAENERELAYLINTEAVKNLAVLCKDFNILLVHYSTDYIFSGAAEDEYVFPNGYPEDYGSNPVNWYGQTKWDAEVAIRDSGTRHLIVRVSWLCSQFGNNFVKTMLRLGKERGELRIINDQIGSPTFTEEVVRNTMALITANKSGTFHLTSEGKITWFQLAKEIFELTGLKVKIDPITSAEFPTDAKRPHYSKLDTAKSEIIDGVVITNWRVGLKKLLVKLV